MPRIVDVHRKRSDIAAACSRLIVRRGIDGITTREIAREAGIGTGVLFHYFKDKEAVIVAATGLIADSYRQYVRDNVRGAPDSLTRLRLVAHSNVPRDSVRRNESQAWVGIRAHAYTSPELRLIMRAHYAGWREVLASLVADAIADGQLRSDVDPMTAAAQLSGLTDGLVVQLLLEPDDSDFAGVASTSVDQLIDSWIVSEKPTPLGEAVHSGGEFWE